MGLATSSATTATTSAATTATTDRTVPKRVLVTAVAYNGNLGGRRARKAAPGLRRRGRPRRHLGRADLLVPGSTRRRASPTSAGRLPSPRRAVVANNWADLSRRHHRRAHQRQRVRRHRRRRNGWTSTYQNGTGRNWCSADLGNWRPPVRPWIGSRSTWPRAWSLTTAPPDSSCNQQRCLYCFEQ